MKNIKSFKINGINAVPCNVQAKSQPGSGVHPCGLSSEETKESFLRIVTAMQSCGYILPRRKIVLDVLPGSFEDEAKMTAHLDLPLALGIIAEKENIPSDGFAAAGELGLDGSVRFIRGAWPFVLKCIKENVKNVILPRRDAEEVWKFLSDEQKGKTGLFGVETLKDAVYVMKGEGDRYRMDKNADKEESRRGCDKAEILARKGRMAFRAMEIAAAGGHGVLYEKTKGGDPFEPSVCAAAQAELMPYPALEKDRLLSILSVSARNLKEDTPFRQLIKQMTLSETIGSPDAPGEVTLAHGGVLKMDFSDLPKSVRIGLRNPREDGKIRISRLRTVTEYPSDFIPFICLDNADRKEVMEETAPFRCDVHLKQNALTENNENAGTLAREARRRIAKAERMQKERFSGLSVRRNGDIPDAEVRKFCAMEEKEEEQAMKIVRALGFPKPAFAPLMRVARTIADLDGSEDVKARHVAEAAGFRYLDLRTSE